MPSRRCGLVDVVTLSTVDEALTAEQTAEFLAAYRKAFIVKDVRERALKAVCAQFSKRFGVRTQVLQTLAAEDRATNRKKYAKLRIQGASLRDTDRTAAHKPIGGKRRRKKKTDTDPVNSARPASPYAATTGRLNDTAKSSPKGVQKVIGGGSPGLGKNSK